VRDDTEAEVYDACGLDRPIPSEILTGKGVPQNMDHAILWYAKAAAHGGDVSIIAQLGLGSSYHSFGYRGFHGLLGDGSAVFWYKMAANQGDVSAQTFLGNNYLKEAKETQTLIGTDGHDEDSEASYKKAAIWYQKAAERGDAFAQRKLGSMYHSGNGVRQSIEKAVMWYETASADGDDVAPRILAEMYLNGEGTAKYGTEQNYEKAAAEYQKAAERGDTIAQRELGGCYCYGMGVSQSFEMAVPWLLKAAAKDDQFAQSLLGMVYHTGDSSMAPNLKLAEVWYAKAADNGDEGAKDFLAQIRGESSGHEHDIVFQATSFGMHIVVDVAVMRVGSMLLGLVRPTWTKQFRSHSYVHDFASAAIGLCALNAWDPPELGSQAGEAGTRERYVEQGAQKVGQFALLLVFTSLPGISKAFDISTVLVWLSRFPWWLVRTIRLWAERRRRKREKEKAKQKSAAGRDAQAKAKKEKEEARAEAKRIDDEEAAKRKEERAKMGAVKKARKQEAEAAKNEKEMKQLLEKEGKRREKEGTRREQEAKQAEAQAEKQAEKARQEAVRAIDEARREADQARRRDKAEPSRAASAAALYSKSVSSSARPKSSTRSALGSSIDTHNDLSSSTFRVGSLTVYKSVLLGEGSGGTMVYRGRHADGRAVAVKVMDKAVVPEHRARREMRLLQVGNLFRVKHAEQLYLVSAV
jgi:TPR repeat protein